MTIKKHLLRKRFLVLNSLKQKNANFYRFLANCFSFWESRHLLCFFSNLLMQSIQTYFLLF